MFQEMRRKNQEISREECIKILQEEPRGVLAFLGLNGWPAALPMNYLYEDGNIYFHWAKEGHKLEAVKKDNRVSFCVMDPGVRKEGDWALYIQSVIVYGHLERVEDGGKAKSLLIKIGEKYFPEASEALRQADKYQDKCWIMELSIDYMSGKRVHEA